MNFIAFLWLADKSQGVIVDSTSVVSTVTMSSSWLFTEMFYNTSIPYNRAACFPFEQRAWFISTLIPFYIVFPFAVPVLTALSSQRLSSLMSILFYVQFIPALPYLISGSPPSSDYVFFSLTGHPLSRFPVFLIGVIAGILRLRGIHHLTRSPTVLNFIHDIIPGQYTQEQEEE